MHLVSVTMQGFKSFPERTEIRFHPGVTAIVGPNGSGKSNVTDAIRWVLGEQSAKTLRGSKMEDIIFAGTELRRPLSFAEVVLKLDNNDYALPIDASEVEVSRRLYRSGESEYVINRQACRLRDIVELFLDTGIGREGYSIVGQGRIDEVLSNRSEDRRRIFDEAAGISRFKARRDEAGRKLQATELEQQRAEDLLHEISRQLRPLEKQAEQAKRYLHLQAEFKELDLALIYHELDALEAELKALREQDARYTAELSDYAKQETDLEQTMTSGSAHLGELEQQEEEALIARDLASEKLRDHEARIALLRTRLEQMQEQYSSRQARVEHAQGRLKQLARDRAGQEASQATLNQQIDSLNLTLEQQKQVTDAALQERHSLTEALRDLERRRQYVQEQLSERRHQLTLLRQEQGQSAKIEEQLQREYQAVEDQWALARARLQELEGAQNANAISLAETQRRSDQLRLQLEVLRQGRMAADERLQRAERQEEQRVYRLQTLEALRQNYEGYHESVRRLLKRIAGDILEQDIYGPLGDLITVEAGYETAIDVALGAAIQNVVVRNSDTASSLIRILKQERLGRVTFLPLGNLATSQLSGDLLQTARHTAGFIGIASELVNCEPMVAPAVQNTLARTVVMQDLASANRLAAATRYRLRIVTLDGEILMPGGALTGGSRRQRESLLSRPREIEELQEQELTLQNELEEAQANLQSLRQQEESCLEEQTDKADELQILKQEQVKLTTELKQTQTECERIETRKSQLEDEASGLRKQLASAASDSASVSETIETLELDKKQIDPQLGDLDTQLQAKTAQQESELERLQELRSQQAALLAERKAAMQVAEHYQKEYEQQAALVQSYEQEQSEDGELRTGIEDEATELEKLTESLKMTLEASETKRDTLLAERRKHAEALSQAREELGRLQEARQQLALQQTRLQVRFESRQEKLDASRNRLWEDYELTFANRDEWYQEDLKETATRKRLGELREAIRQLGTVNVNAVEEQRELASRRDFMEEQIADISASREELDKLIRQITQSMRTSFAESFEFIRKEFRAVFQELFNGGEADIVLEDEQDILSSVIEIKASPPGKKLQNMLLLSGGERTLCAIALIFALQRLRPAPFCILDEVEAALDESNIFRFNDYVRKQSKEIQFILVTHRKGTMEAADRLYGVTMQEHGVSRMLSLQLT